MWARYAAPLLLLLLASPAMSATINVTANATDSLAVNGQCSLREAITNINNGPYGGATFADCPPTGAYGTNDRINIPAGTYTTTLAGAEDSNATGDYDIRYPVTIIGAGSSSTTINGGGLDRVFQNFSRDTTGVTITGVTITGGTSGWGGGIFNDGRMLIANSIITGNLADGSGAGGGGIFHAGGAFTVINSTITGNSANYGGGIYVGGGPGTTTVINSTISGNAATSPYGSGGGGILSWGTLIITNSTISGNTATTGASGIYNGATATISNTIVASQTSSVACQNTGTLISNGHNLENSVSCGFTGVGDLQNTNPLLGALAYNGGPTKTMALLVGSPAINAGDNAICAAAPVNGLDQRGYSRPAGTTCDIGAFEYGAVLQPPAATFTGARSEYQITQSGSSYTVTDLTTGRDGTRTVTSADHLTFSDMTVNLTVQAKAASIAAADLQRLQELYVAFFKRVPAADGLAYWIDQFKAGSTLSQIADSFYAAGVQYSSLTGFSSTMSNGDFVHVIYRNVLGRPEGAGASGLAYWSGELDSKRETRGSLAVSILNSAHSFKGDATYGWVADLLDNKVAVANQFSVTLGLTYNTPEASISNGMAIAAAVTSTSTAAALALIGVVQ